MLVEFSKMSLATLDDHQVDIARYFLQHDFDRTRETAGAHVEIKRCRSVTETAAVNAISPGRTSENEKRPSSPERTTRVGSPRRSNESSALGIGALLSSRTIPPRL